MTKMQRKALDLRIAILDAELLTCTTVAMRKCVQQALYDAYEQRAAMNPNALTF